MSRKWSDNTTYNDEVKAALAAQHVEICSFAKLEFPSGTVYLHNSLGTFTWGGNDWLGVGDLGSISQVEEAMDVSPYAITLTLSGLNSTITGAALTENYFMHGATIYIGVLDENAELITTPTQIWSGYMDQMNMTIGADGGDGIQMVCESELSRFNRASNLMYTNVAQQEKSSGDLFFNNIHKVEGAKINWGAQQLPGGIGTPVIPTDFTNITY
jgi:hypothetical protein